MALSANAYAEVPPDFRKTDLQLIPAWCAYTSGEPGTRDHPEIFQGYVQRYGDGWTHMHHYCYALLFIISYGRYSPQRQYPRVWYVQRAVSNLDYVLRETKTDFVLRPDVYLKRAEILYRDGQIRDAIASLNALIEEWPKRAEGYTRLAYYLRKSGKASEADRVIASAKANVADQDELQAAMRRYDAMLR